ncbi:MAG: XkdW family protein [Rubrivivax sp.]
MSYFTHDQMARAIKYLHPTWEHGKDFLVLMGINTDGTPASDAWIDRWPADVPVPTLQALKDAYAAALLEPTPPAPLATSCTPLQFIDRFTEAEQLAVVSATLAVPQVKLWYDKLIAATEVVFADPRVAAGLDALVAAGLLTQARSEAILPLNVRSSGVPSL